MAESRNLLMSEVLSHPLGPLPWSLASPDGNIRKTNKAALGNHLKKNYQPLDNVPRNSAIIFDGMSIVQKIHGEQKTFGNLADSILSLVLRESAPFDRIDIVFDTYRENSIKS